MQRMPSYAGLVSTDLREAALAWAGTRWRSMLYRLLRAGCS